MAKQIQIDILANDKTRQAFNSVKKNTEGAKTSLLSLKNVLLAVASSVIIRRVLDLGNTFQSLQNRLKLVTSSTEELGKVQQDLFEISQRTRGGFEETVTLYSKLALNSKNLKLQTSELAEITENVNKVVAIAGVNSVQASAGILQLSQAFASGRLQGDEFRSISENIPPLLDIFAKELGVTRGELKKLGSEGKITSEVIANSLLKETENINKQFGQLSPTIGQASTTIANSLLNLVGQTLEVTGASEGLASILLKISEYLDNLTFKVEGYVEAFEDLYESLKPSSILFKLFGLDVYNTGEAFKKAGKDAEAFQESMALVDETLYGAGRQLNANLDEIIANAEAQADWNAKIKDAWINLYKFNGALDSTRRLERELAKGVKDNTPTYDTAFDELIAKSQDLETQIDGLAVRTFNDFSDTLTDALMTGKANFKDFARSVVRDLASIIIKQQLAIATQKLLGSFGGSSNVFGSIASGIGAIFGRANGGTVQANKPYMVGERGAELFVPNTNGTIVPNGQTTAGANVNITINTVDARGIDELLTDRRSTIVNLINDALNSQGREALV